MSTGKGMGALWLYGATVIEVGPASLVKCGKRGGQKKIAQSDGHGGGKTQGRVHSIDKRLTGRRTVCRGPTARNKGEERATEDLNLSW